jgi:hypothetical protein
MQTDAIREYYENEFNQLAAGVERDDFSSIGEPVTAENPREETFTPVTLPSTSAPLAIDATKRVGIHYFPDDDHYSSADLERWLPILQNLGVNWIVLRAPLDRAIPQDFIDALIAAEINPVIHFNASLVEPPTVQEIRPLLAAYASWGVRFVVFFDRPNLRSQWPVDGWTQRGLVTRFLGIFEPFARASIEAGLTPVFPALEPGGDFWDTAFLRAALEALAESGEGTLRESLAIGAYAWTEDRSMTWGAGGPENWPATMPYHTPANSEDQRGFRIFDWYNAISRAVLGKELPIILIGAGVQRESGKELDAQQGTRAIKMTEALQRKPDPNKNNAVPENVLACNFWLLAAKPETLEAPLAWYKINGKPTKFADEYLAWKLGIPEEKSIHQAVKVNHSVEIRPQAARSLQHYLLLPSTGDWPMDRVRAFISATQAAMGISEQDAINASRVTLAGGLDAFTDDLLRNLIQAGCQVDLLPFSEAI